MMKYYSDRKKKNTIPSVATTWVEPENIMLSEINQRLATNAPHCHLHVQAEKVISQ